MNGEGKGKIARTDQCVFSIKLYRQCHTHSPGCIVFRQMSTTEFDIRFFIYKTLNSFLALLRFVFVLREILLSPRFALNLRQA